MAYKTGKISPRVLTRAGHVPPLLSIYFVTVGKINAKDRPNK